MSGKISISCVGEFVGLLGLIASLIFVGIEIRQGTIATRAATDTVIADAFRELNQVMASSPELARAMTAWPDSPDSLSAADQIQVLGLWRALFHHVSCVRAGSRRRRLPTRSSASRSPRTG